MKAVFLGSLLAVFVAGSAAATTYKCTFAPQGRSGGGIPEVVIIDHNTSTGVVRVNDPLIQNYVGSPVTGTLKSLNATRALFAWSLPSLKSEDGNWISGVSYSVNIIRASGAASISANLLGGYVPQRGKGSCKAQ